MWLCLAISPLATGCPYSIRDVGFVDLNSIPYRLYFFLKGDTPRHDLLSSTFQRASEIVLMDSNVEAEIVHVDQQESHPAMEYLRFWEIETFPSAILISPRGHSMVLSFSDPPRPFEETVRSALEKVVSSPAREEVMDNIVRAWGVVLLVEGKDPAENARAKQVVKEVVSDIARSMNRAGRTVEEAPYLIALSPPFLPDEEILLWSLGLEDYDSRGPRLAVLYGRGRQLGPVFEGDVLTRNSLYQALSVLGMKCGCDADLDWLSRTTIPHRWGRKLRANVVRNLGFDPDNPMVKMEVSTVWSGVPAPEEDAEAPFAYSEGEITSSADSPLLEEGPVQVREARDPSAGSPVDAGLVASSRTVSSFDKRIRRVMLLSALSVVTIILGASAFILSRARHKNARP
jgi:hypothetical protein